MNRPTRLVRICVWLSEKKDKTGYELCALRSEVSVVGKSQELLTLHEERKGVDFPRVSKLRADQVMVVQGATYHRTEPLYEIYCTPEDERAAKNLLREQLETKTRENLERATAMRAAWTEYTANLTTTPCPKIN